MKSSSGSGGSIFQPALMIDGHSGLPPVVRELCAALAANGIQCFGGFMVEAADIPGGINPPMAGMPALLFGNAGPAMWRHFSQSAEFGDGGCDPLNRWTERVVAQACAAVPEAGKGAQRLFPFGEPVWPFQRWTKRAMGLQTSPLGMLVHPEYGLWFALRAAIVIPDLECEVEKLIQLPENLIHPYDTCAGKPCLNACPVEAFSDGGFDAAGCRSYLHADKRQATPGLPDCMEEGCAARNACPVGRDWRYGEAQLRFHMQAFAR